MTANEVLEKIENKISKDNKWCLSKSTFHRTRIEPWFNIQTIEQLPIEIKVPKYGKPQIIVNESGVEIHGDFYPWADICVTGYITEYKQLGILVIGLTNGEIEEAQGPSDWRMGIDELGHLIELYKIKNSKREMWTLR